MYHQALLAASIEMHEAAKVNIEAREVYEFWVTRSRPKSVR